MRFPTSVFALFCTKSMLQVKIVNAAGAFPPERQTDGAAGYDLYAPAPITIAPGARQKIPMGIAVSIPDGYVGFLKTRSSMALVGIDVVGGVIDSDYRGEVAVILHNTDTSSAYRVSARQRIAQLVVLPVFTGGVHVVTDLDMTRRGSGGFGSTGILPDASGMV